MGRLKGGENVKVSFKYYPKLNQLQQNIIEELQEVFSKQIMVC